MQEYWVFVLRDREVQLEAKATERSESLRCFQARVFYSWQEAGLGAADRVNIFMYVGKRETDH